MKKELAIIFIFLGSLVLVCFCFNRIGYLKPTLLEGVKGIWTTRDNKSTETRTSTYPAKNNTDSSDTTALDQMPIKLRGIVEKRFALKNELTG